MGDNLMGLDTFVERKDGHRYVKLDDASGKETRLRLDKAMVRQKAIVCRGTTCYVTQDSHVALGVVRDAAVLGAVRHPVHP